MLLRRSLEPASSLNRVRPPSRPAAEAGSLARSNPYRKLGVVADYYLVVQVPGPAWDRSKRRREQERSEERRVGKAC